MLLPQTVEAACTATIVGGASFGTLQAAIDAAASGSTIRVAGRCEENVTIPERKERITLDGLGEATISGPSPSVATVRVRGRGAIIAGFTITGGENGIQLQRATATIDDNIIQATGSNGILLSGSFATITNNQIHNNPAGSGILVNENSSVRIGFFDGGDTVASPNTIQNNGNRGILVSRASNARIVGNTIAGNGDDGVSVLRDSQASISANMINSNAGDGVFVSSNSGINLGADTGTSIFELPNSSTANNTGFGVRCTLNAYGNGRIGALNGVSGASSLTGSCINSLIP